VTQTRYTTYIFRSVLMYVVYQINHSVTVSKMSLLLRFSCKTSLCY